MTRTSITVDVDSAAVVVALSAFRAGLDNQPAAYQAAGQPAADAARAAAHKRSGAMAATVQARPTGAQVEITAGSTVVVYAGVQNYGWPARNIAAQHYLEQGKNALGLHLVTELQNGIRALAGRVGLN